MSAEYEKALEEQDFRCYIADSINLSVDRRKFTRLYSERYETQVEDNRTAEEIIADVVRNAELTIE